MKKYFLTRLIQLVPILFGITFLTFAMMQFTADDAVDKIYEQSDSVTEESGIVSNLGGGAFSLPATPTGA